MKNSLFASLSIFPSQNIAKEPLLILTICDFEPKMVSKCGNVAEGWEVQVEFFFDQKLAGGQARPDI